MNNPDAIFKIKSSEENLYENFIRSINFLMKDENNKASTLTDRELEVLAALMKLNVQYNSLPKPQREEYLLSPHCRKIIRDSLDIQPNHFSNILSKLKTKKFLKYWVISTEFWDLGKIVSTNEEKPTVIQLEIYDTGSVDRGSMQEVEDLSDEDEGTIEQDREVYDDEYSELSEGE